MPVHAYFPRLAARQRLLEEHGFDRYPTEDELLDYVLEMSDRLNALYEALGLIAVEGRGGSWRTRPARCEGVRHG